MMSGKATPFDPDAFFSKWNDKDFIPSHENAFSFRDCIIKAFDLSKSDDYVYRAQGVTTLELTQKAINGKRAHGLHNWYHDEQGNPISPPHPTSTEISAYTTLFTPTQSPLKALRSYTSSTPKSSPLRLLTSTHLTSLIHNPFPQITGPLLCPSSTTRAHKNPYLSLWTYSCHELEWSGPIPQTVHTKISHHILPVFYHHFGCVVPTYAALHVLAKLAQPAKPSKEPVRPILDIGSGNGYWTYMLRSFPLPSSEMKELDVRAIDNQVSEYRTTWINDTIIEDGVKYLQRKGIDGGRGCVLLLVYPQATGGFTEGVLRGFKGEWIVVAGTQNGNGFTGFQGERIEDWVGRELKGEWELVLRMPLPSFAGKDEGFYVWRRRSSA